MGDLDNLTTQQVGRSGELLIQYRLSRSGIDSAPMTVDYGIDLLAFHPKTHKSVSIQVKTSRHLGETSKWLEWGKGERDVAEYMAVVDLVREKAWLFKSVEFKRLASGNYWLWWYVPGHSPARTTINRSENDYEKYEIDVAIPKLFSK